MTAPSYTAEHPVEHNYVCEACSVTMSGDRLFGEVVEFWQQRHEHCDDRDG